MDIRVSECLSERRVVRIVPRTMTSHRELYRAREVKPALGKRSDFGLRITPLLPVTTADSSPNPAIELWNRRPVLRVPEVAHPTTKVFVQLGNTMFPRDSPAPTRKCTDLVLKIFKGFNRPPNSFPWERKSQEFTLTGFACFAFLAIYLEL